MWVYHKCLLYINTNILPKIYFFKQQIAKDGTYSKELLFSNIQKLFKQKTLWAKSSLFHFSYVLRRRLIMNTTGTYI